ncbi:MAG: cation diffusion facilitator CzcD-associated flavoprotein CzcO [Hyphomicrobiaceae bacterium]|jgi:cation diffusion facilitator CzcD-associated flavoprotein CzcO
MNSSSVDDQSRQAHLSGGDFQIAIIGSGFGGIGMAIALKKAGIDDFVIFERANEIGGTWRDNTYPGAACDVPSHVYSFSFEPNPNWSRAFARSGEIQQYLLGVVEKYGLRRHLRLNTNITNARFEEADGSWTLTTATATASDGDFRARFVVSAVGGLVDPAFPDIKGLENFKGKLVHAARWDHDYDLAGKRVAVIGTGATAIQVVPSIAPQVEKLVVFQRTPAWVMPKSDHAISERAKALYRRLPFVQRIVRSALFWLSEAFGPVIMLDAPWLSRLGERASQKHLEQSVPDPELRAKLMPHFQFGCKRILISNDYWASFDRDNVELETESIAEIREHSVVLSDGREHEIDTLILATGFVLGLATAPFPVSGLGGVNLDETWKGGAVAYKGVCVSGFPNWFMIMGPNTGPGHTSVLVYSESQINYIAQAIQRVKEDQLKYLTVRQDVQDAYNQSLQKRMPYTVWASGCNSWYLSESGENHALFPGFASEYCARVRKFKPSEYVRVG